MSDGNKRRCSACNKEFTSRAGCDMHIAQKHKGNAERIAVIARAKREPSMASMFIEGEMNRAMGIENSAWLEDMLP